MKIIEKIHAAAADPNRVVFSFEFFPPKTEDGVDNLFERMDRMVAHNPSFCDITWGAGGTTADLTLEIANKMQNIVCVETMMHLTCTNMPVEKIDHALQTIKSNGLQNVLALRGDPPHGQDKFVQVEGGFACARDLVPIRFTSKFPHVYIIHFVFANLSSHSYRTISPSLRLCLTNSRLHLAGL